MLWRNLFRPLLPPHPPPSFGKGFKAATHSLMDVGRAVRLFLSFGSGSDFSLWCASRFGSNFTLCCASGSNSYFVQARIQFLMRCRILIKKWHTPGCASTIPLWAYVAHWWASAAPPPPQLFTLIRIWIRLPRSRFLMYCKWVWGILPGCPPVFWIWAEDAASPGFLLLPPHHPPEPAQQSRLLVKIHREKPRVNPMWFANFWKVETFCIGYHGCFTKILT